ncbi:GmrSD restriction endonuclease domain-containing protein [Pediococcus damnosus]|uniref:GmrSD restriction endonuclease domain-containing protein n=1 Tax=Pediococcus damnosus TaxID=51663 RepID=UPI003F6D416D
MNKYQVQNNSIETLLNWIDSGEMGLPELQRPFVWRSVKVRDLIDSLYNGFPIGYIITWINPTVHLKNGQAAIGKQIIIDGQQRMTALKAAISGQEIVDNHFKKYRIKIAFNPFTESFATTTPAIEKDKRWIADIAQLFKPSYSAFTFITDFARKNDVAPEAVDPKIQKVLNLVHNDIGNIIISPQLDIDSVTEIFNRINSKGTVLSSADFIMSKLAADTKHGGNTLRKTVEYFSQLLVDPGLIRNLKDTDPEFVSSKFFQHIKWAANEYSNLYTPNFSDMFHVVLGTKFGRGKHSELIALVSGRDFKTQSYTEEAQKHTYELLEQGIWDFTNQSNFQRYMMILNNLGMIGSGTLTLNGKGTFNFGYMLFMVLDKQKLTQSELETIVKKWIIMSAITQRYSGSAETQSEADIKLFLNVSNQKAVAGKVFNQELVSSFWEVTLPEKLVTSSTSSGVWRVFQMSQVYRNGVIWLEKDHTVKSVITEQRNVHHIFPKAYLKSNGFKQAEFNQVANFTWLTQPRNLEISDRSPKKYLADAKVTEYASEENHADNAIPIELKNFESEDYIHFLELRRHLIANKIREYFESL